MRALSLAAMPVPALVAGVAHVDVVENIDQTYASGATLDGTVVCTNDFSAILDVSDTAGRGISVSAGSCRPKPRWRACRARGIAVFAFVLAMSTVNASAHAKGIETHPEHGHGAPRVAAAMAQYTIPSVQLVRDDDKVISLPQEMNDGRPVVLNFIFTSCSSICPFLSSVFAEFDRRLGPDRNNVHLMSISIDPEADTPARLREYAGRFKAGPEWQHYTGTVEATLAAQRAFGVYRGDKMSHAAVTLLRAAPGRPWLRLDGFVTPAELMKHYRRLLKEPGQAVAAR
jgi:protein SCO1/2